MIPRAHLQQVKASAGSGKTYDLTRRFLEHLSRTPQQAHTPQCALYTNTQAHWGDILAITFTNSAAAEMKERVLTRLKKTALELTAHNPQLAARNSEWVDIILRQYSALNIRTIDSLLHMIVRTATLDLRLPPDFEPAFTSDETLSPILEDCLEKAWQGDAHMQELIHNACRGLIFEQNIQGFTAGERIYAQLRPLLEIAFTKQWPDLSPPHALKTHIQKLRSACTVHATELVTYLAHEACNVHKTAHTTFEKYARGECPDRISAFVQKEHVQECLNKNSCMPSQEAIQAYDALCKAITRHAQEGKILRAGLRLLPFAYFAQEVGKQLDDFQHATGKVPAMLMYSLAQQVLEAEHGVPTALCRLGSTLTHILIDEFQDTSHPQWKALRPLVQEALSRGGSLTWVGDVKQAIYGWRQGDAALFDSVLHDASLLAIAPEPEQHSLNTNWRSHKVIVESNNHFFSLLENPVIALDVLRSILPDACPAAILGRAAAELTHVFAHVTQNTCTQKAEGGYVTITAVQGTNKATLTAAVQTALQQRLLKDIAPRHAWADIAILTRGNEEAACLAQWLTAWGVPVITENSLRLHDHPLIVETLAFLQFLHNTNDDSAFWTTLQGHILAPALEENTTAPSIDTWALQRAKGPMGHAFREAFPRIWARVFAPFYTTANLMSPYDTVQEWYALHQVQKRFPHAHTYVRRFLEILHNAAERGYASIGTFLAHWQQDGMEEKVPMPSNANAVRIMTIHKAKGLQFPVVILPWTNFLLKEDHPVIPWKIDNLHIIAPRCKEMGDIHYEAQAAAAREALNVLYVAWTRPEKELHVLHTSMESSKKRTLDKAIDVLFTKAGWQLPLVMGTPADDAHVAPIIAPQPTACTHPTQPAQEDPWYPMQWLPRLKIFRNPLGELQQPQKYRGILAHHCLRHIHLTGDALADAHNAVIQGIRTFSLAPQTPVDVDNEQGLIDAIAWYIAMPDTPQWLRTGLPEHTLMDVEGTFHRVDLLVPPAQNNAPWLVVEYKTGHPTHEEEHKHRAQVLHYINILDNIPSGYHKAQGIIIYLDMRQCRNINTEKACCV